MKTKMMLILRHNATPTIPVEIVAKEYFDLSLPKFHKKINEGEILLPVLRMEDSQKCAKSVHIDDLSDYLDRRTEAARKVAAAYGYGV